MLKRWWIVIGATAAMGFTSPAGAATPEQVRAAMKKAEAYLYSQEANGTWDAPAPDPAPSGAYWWISPTGGEYGGWTAVTTYALLSAGEDPKDPRLASAIKFLETADIDGVYALGIRCLVWHSLPNAASDPAMHAAMNRDMALLRKAVTSKAMYDYFAVSPKNWNPGPDDYDHSVSQFGVLGMWALQEAGMEVPMSYWRGIAAAWRRDQLADGGWDYHGSGGSNGSTATMTAAGVATLFLSQDEMLMGMGSGGCRGNVHDPAIDAGLDWMAHHFDEVFIPSGNASPGYALYCLERIGVASGRVYFKDINWFNRGADFLVKNQSADGSWMGPSAFGEPSTALALLFLARGGAPVTMNKLQYFDDVNGKPQEADWNERPRDIANFNPWLAGQVEFPKVLNWQVLTLDAAPADLHSAPVLLVSGDKALHFSDADETKLKKFIDQGGLVLFNADCESEAFSESVIKLGAKLYPLNEFRRLTRDDTIFSHEQFQFGNETPKVMALSNGVRELMVLVPNGDISRAWEGRRSRGERSKFELGANILMYACDKTGILHKGDTYLVEANPKVIAKKTIKVARVQYNGNWDPEPEAWARMAAIMHNRAKMDLQIDSVTPGQGKLAGHQVAVLTGTGTPHMEQAGWDEIAQFVKKGGTLIVDTAGGATDSTFSSAMMDQLSAMFPDQATALDSPLNFSDAFYAKIEPAMTEVHFRPFARTAVSDMSQPQIRAMKFGKRIGVFFSREDLTEGLVGEHIDGIVGYQPDTAALLMQKMLMSAGGN